MLKKKIYGLWLSFLVVLFGVDFAKQFDTYLRFKRKLNLKNPQTLSDKVTYLFLHKQTPLMSTCTDKWEVRKYIEEKGLADILIPTVGGPWNKVEEIDFDKLPNKFILKATHGCKMNYVVEDKSKLDIIDCKKTLQKWLNTTYGTYSLEPHYKKIPHRVYAEELLKTEKGLIDYKIHCLNGIPNFILVCSDRKNNFEKMTLNRNLFSINWQTINEIVITEDQSQHSNIQKPLNLTQMLEVAKTLSLDFTFVRVDLYTIKEKIYFGELTFSPACGVFSHFSDKFITYKGKYLNI